MKIKNKIALLLNTAIIATMAYSVSSYEKGFVEADEVSQTEVYLANIEPKQIRCLALNVYFEARNQSEDGQRAIAHVTLNRMKDERFPNTICKVVWQKGQFSWTHDGKSDRPGGNVIENRAWELAQKIAVETLVEDFESSVDPTNGSVMFHADYVRPYWRKSFERVAQIDDHIFYK